MIRFARIKRKAGAASLAFVFAFVSVVTPLTGLTQRAAAVAEPAPVNLRALVGGNSIGLVWNPAPGSTPTQYKVYRNGVLRATVNPVTDNFSGTTQRYIDTGVVGGTQYTYQIAAMNASFEESQWSSWAQVTQPTNPAPVPTITLDPSIPASLLPLMNNGKALLQAWYPKIHTKLGSVAGVPTSFTLDTDPSPAIVAQTLGTTITVGETFATNNASNAALINNMFIHEATHVIQQYSGLQWAVEGIADYASRYIYGTDTALAINTSTTSWMDGYSSTAALLNWASVTYNKPNLARDFHVMLGTTYPAQYDVNFFRAQTGLTLGELWEKMTGKLMTSPMLLKNAGSGNKCLTLLNGNTTDLNPFILHATCYTGNDVQQFMYVPDTSTSNQGAVKLKNKCLNVNGNGTANGTVVSINTCNNGLGQKWILQVSGAIKNPNSGKCLRPVNNGTTTNTTMEIWTCDGTSMQNWTQLPPGAFKNYQGFGCVSASAVYPNPVKVYACGDGTPAMMFQYKQPTPGAASGAIVNRGNGFCMEPLNGSSAVNATMSMVACDGSTEQLWQWQSNNTVKNMANNLCLTLPAWAAPWELTQTTCAATPNGTQKFDRLQYF